MDSLNFTRQGMPKSFAELLTPEIVIVNTKKLVGNIQNFGPLKFSLDPLNLGFAVLKGSEKYQLNPLYF